MYFEINCLLCCLHVNLQILGPESVTLYLVHWHSLIWSTLCSSWGRIGELWDRRSGVDWGDGESLTLRLQCSVERRPGDCPPVSGALRLLTAQISALSPVRLPPLLAAQQYKYCSNITQDQSILYIPDILDTGYRPTDLQTVSQE